MSICVWDIHKRRSHILQLHLQKGGYDVSESVDMRIKKSGLHVYLQEENREHYHCCCNQEEKKSAERRPLFKFYSYTRDLCIKHGCLPIIFLHFLTCCYDEIATSPFYSRDHVCFGASFVTRRYCSTTTGRCCRKNQWWQCWFLGSTWLFL